jgi:hypothetical protein
MSEAAVPEPDLREYSKEHLWYEVWMFFRLGSLISRKLRFESADVELRTILENLIIEGFVLHLRNLLDFFYGEPRRNDMAAGMFYEWEKLPNDFPVESDVLKDAHRRAHKELSHLTTERRPYKKRGWENAPELMTDMKTRLENFVTGASAEKLHPDFIKQTKTLLRLL